MSDLGLIQPHYNRGDQRVCVSLVTYNSLQWLTRCITSVQAQTHQPVELIMVDNASTDGTRQFMATNFPWVEVIWNRQNLGFCAAHNQVIRSTAADFVLVLNPDVILTAGFVEGLVAAACEHPTAASFSGKLLRMTEAEAGSGTQRIDHMGFFPLRNGSHWEPGAGQLDDGRWSGSTDVFGVSGAAALYRRSALQTIEEEGEFFDESFFIYAEDIDLAWRLRLHGWKARYEPRAVAFHARNLPSDVPRRARGSLVNFHLTKNRYLIFIKNYPGIVFMRNGLSLAAWTIASIFYLCLFERDSLPALAALMRLLPRALRRRRRIMHTRVVRSSEVLAWFKETNALRRKDGSHLTPLLLERARQLFRGGEA